MDNSTYLIPANTKNGALILNVFRPFDLILLLSGITVTMILLFVLSAQTLPLTILILSPAVICAFLILPIPNYHNVLCVITGMYNFFTERRVFIWKGWCIYGSETDQK